MYKEDKMDDIDRLFALEQHDLESTINTAQVFVKRGCKKCCERGYNIYDMIDKKDPSRKYLRYCDCVYKNMKKYK